MMFHVFSECGSKCGYGHISRCLSLIENFPANSLTFIWHIKLDCTTDTVPELQGHVDIGDWSQWPFSAFSCSDDVYLFDVYTVDLDRYLDTGISLNIMSITDGKLNYYSKGIVLCPSLYSNILFRDHKPKHLFNGEEYFFISTKIAKHLRNEKIYSSQIETIGISLGGTVQSENLHQIIQLIFDTFPSAKIQLFGTELLSTKNIYSHGFILREQYLEIISELDLMVTGSGQSLNEAALIGLPVVPIALNKGQCFNRDFWCNKLSIEYKCSIWHKSFKSNFIKSLKLNLSKTLSYNERIYLLKGGERLSSLLFQKIKSLKEAQCI